MKKKRTVKKRPRKKALRKKTTTAAKKRATKRTRSNAYLWRNPKRRRAIIGDEALSLTYRGGEGKRKNSTPWIHKFEHPVQIIGESDGSIRLVSTEGLRLWDYF